MVLLYRFTGTSLGCVTRCNLCALENDDFRTVGQMLAVIIVQGGEAPRIFSPAAVCSYISKGSEACKPDIDEIPDPVFRNSLKQVLQSFVF
jgi:hypothetical protein